MSIECQIKKIFNLDTSYLTVGEKFFLICQGNEIGSKLVTLESISLGSINPYQLKILNVRKISSSEIELLTTSVVIGTHKIPHLMINGREVSPFSFEVISVQNPQQPVEKPFGPMLPKNNWPPMYAVGSFLILIILIIILGIFNGLRKRSKRKRYEEFLKTIRKERSALEELTLELGKVRRSFFGLKENAMGKNQAQTGNDLLQTIEHINKAILIFLGRLFQYPLPLMSTRELQTFKKKLKQKYINNKDINDLIRFLDELDHIKNNQDIKEKDMEYLIDWFLDLAPKLIIKTW